MSPILGSINFEKQFLLINVFTRLGIFKDICVSLRVRVVEIVKSIKEIK